jgi:WD40 repeat protein
MVKLDCMSRAVTYSPDGNYIAVGLGGLVEGKDPKGPIGGFKILQDEDFAIATEGRDSRQWITSIKYSPDGRGMACSSRDGKLYIYDVEDAYKLGNVFKKAKGAILNFDYSDDSTFIQLNDETGSLLFCDATTGMQIPSANELKDLEWGSLTCTMQWSMRGLWPARSDVAGAVAVKAIQNVAVSQKVTEGDKTGAAMQQRMVARFDPDGQITVFNYPCTQLGSVGTSYSGHATDVAGGVWAGEGFPATRVSGVGGGEKKDDNVEEGKGEEKKQIAGNRYLMSIGGRDRCLMRWDCVYVDGDVDAKPYEAKQTDGSLQEMCSGMCYKKDGSLIPPEDSNDRLRFRRALAEESKTKLQRGFIGNVVDPSDPQPHDPMKPPVKVELEHIYGSSMQEHGRDNIHYGGSVTGSNIVYVAGKYGVVYTKDGNKQTFFDKHDDDITCLSVDPPSGRFAVSGQRGVNPVVRLWNIDTATEICCMPQVHRGSIIDVKFNTAGTYVASIGMGDSFDPSYTLAIYSDPTRSPVGMDWSGKCTVLAFRNIGVEPVLVTHFVDRVQSSLDYDLFTGGTSTVFFWEHEGKILTKTRGMFDRTAKVQPQCSACTIGDALVTGTACGQLYVWSGKKVKRVVPAHRGMVSTMQVVGTEKMITGSRDGTIKIWDRSLEIIRTFDMKTMANQSCVKPYVRSVSMDRSLERIVVGLASSDIYEICYASGSSTLLSRGHFEGELWGLAPHPTDPTIVVTSGDDTTVRVWDASLHEMVQIANVEAPCRAVEWSPRGDLIGLGTGTGAVDKGDGEEEKSGAIVLLNAESLEIVHEGRDSREWIHVSKFSPDGKLFIVGSEDKEILVYDIAKGFKLKSKCQKHKAPIASCDFSKCSTWIRSNCVNNDLNYFRANSGEVNAGGGKCINDRSNINILYE